MLELKHISKKFQEKVILDDISIVFPHTGFVGIKGESGCGKSTLLYIIGMLDDNFTGEVFYNQKLVENRKLFIQQHISYMMQNKDIIAALNVKENIVLASLVSQKRYTQSSFLKIVRQLGIQDYLDRYPHQLSGGQLKRVSIAKALLKQSDIILCDEPTGALHSEQSIEVMKILQKVSQQSLVIIVSHDDELLNKYCDHVLTLKDGKLNGQVKSQSIESTPVFQRKRAFLWFYPIKQFIRQKNKFLCLFFFQWIVILSFFFIVCAFQGVFEAITSSEQHSVDRQMMTVEKKDGQPFVNLISDSQIYHVQYTYHLEQLKVSSQNQDVETTLQFLPLQSQHIILKEGRLPTSSNEVVVTSAFQNQFSSLTTLQINFQTFYKDLSIVGVIESDFFSQNTVYCLYQLQNEIPFLKDNYSLLIEVQKNQERSLYQTLSATYFVYNDLIERVDNYHSLLSLGQMIAAVFIAVSFIVSLLLIGIVESIIYLERKHDTAYLFSLGLYKRRLFLLTLSEAFLLGIVMSIGGCLLSAGMYYYLNEVYGFMQHFGFKLSLPRFLFSQYDLYLMIIVSYILMVILGICIPMKHMMKVDMIEVLREE